MKIDDAIERIAEIEKEIHMLRLSKQNIQRRVFGVCDGDILTVEKIIELIKRYEKENEKRR